MLKIDEKVVAQLNADADDLAHQFDLIITQYVNQLEEDNGYTPFVVLAAIASVLTKVAMVTENDSEFVFETLRDMVPNNEALKAMAEFDNLTTGNVIPLSFSKH